MNHLDWSIGLKVKVTTILDNSITGKIYSFDQVTNTVSIHDDKKDSYRIIKSSFIKDIAVLDSKNSGNKRSSGSSKQGFSQVEPAIGPVSVNAAVKREREAVQAAKKAILSKGVGVSAEGQFVFDTLSRTLPCRWHEKSIVVFDEVVVDPPYTSESCRADNEQSSALSLVRKNVIGAQEKMGKEMKGG